MNNEVEKEPEKEVVIVYCYYCNAKLTKDEIIEKEAFDGNVICEDCSNSVTECQNCDGYFVSNNHDYENFCCESCHDDYNDSDNDSGEDSYREVNIKTDIFLSTPTPESIVLSKRIFSSEIECIDKEDNTSVFADINNAIGITEDGSLNSGGVEIVTPRLSGITGENLIKDISSRLQKLHFTVDNSCGMHIHIDIPEITNKVKEEKKTILESELSPYRYSTSIPPENSKLVNGIYRNNENEIPETRSHFTKSDISSLNYFNIVEVTAKNLNQLQLLKNRASELLKSNIEVINNEKASKIISFIKKASSEIAKCCEYYPAMLKTPITIGGYPFFKYDDREIYSNYLRDRKHQSTGTLYNQLKNIMLFYLNFENTILSFIPQSRSQNRFCIPLSQIFHRKEILDCENLEAVEQLWYRDSDTLSRESRKKEKYDHTRYAGVNFHSLLSNGHIEIRFHSGTIDSDKILHWIALHTAIIDYCMTTPLLNNLIKEKTLKRETDKMFELLQKDKRLKPETIEYLFVRQKKFLSDNEDTE